MASSIAIPELNFLFPQSTPRRCFSLSRNSRSRLTLYRNHGGDFRLRSGIRAAKEDGGVVVEEREKRLIESGNGAATASTSGNGYALDGSVEGHSNGGVSVVETGNGASNGSLAKYVNGNGVAAAEAEVVAEVRDVEVKEEGRKKRIEEIGKEDAWFKQSGSQNVEVSVAPGGRWSRFKTYSTIQRTLEIWGFVLTFIFKAWLNNRKFTYRGGMTEKKKVLRRKALAKWLKESILRLGPTFIKIGQQFSTRVDILAQEYVDQLSELQDQVPPFPSETAVSIIEEELGAPVNEIFDKFYYEPIAAASLGQVHRARLKGEEVVVKVQRPGLKGLFDIDLKNLRVIAEYLQKIDPKSDGAKRDWVAIYDECASVLYQEIDYNKEAANAELFASNFKNMDYVKVPEILWEYTTPQVLTMEYVPGIKINKIQALDQLGVDRKRLGRYAVESYLEQILSHGFFHADPHPGNIAVDDVNGGRLIFYDFGMMGSPNIREGLLEVFYGVYEKDPDKVLQAMIQMGVLVPTGDMTAVRRTALFFLNSFEERLAAQREEREMATTELGFKRPLTKEEKTMKKKERLAAIGEDLLAIAADQPFRFPATFTFVVRAFSVLDGIGKGLDPRFDITEIAKPYALELLKFREAGIEVILKDVRKRWDRQSQAFYNLFRQADRVAKLAEIIQRLEQGDLKLRVRALESERAFQRVATVQKTIGNAVAAGSLVNLATILYINSIRVPAIGAYTICAFFGFQVLIGLIKVKKLDERERLITGTA
ncbi:protein ACTIVITY OF BC1 COMPLEX KINASE 8, chloroplastic isoform X2 [Morus notabilis]|uniref:protein ACTIVITY OF BC1 COMPLEX KINASE 8, chloroplastic isoform X2 n=1 Tax=Morus notabilis TaxID=981085 RepID=UPI000CED115B|nr:protein ACTIVITY OF BC1 COMPLEX KINASE 8, chloroplastic isoform X2 [Morus notabilis]